MKVSRRSIRIVFVSLLAVCAMFILLLVVPASGGQKGMQIRWTGKMSLHTQEERHFVHGDAEPFETVTRYNIGPIQVETKKRRRD